MKAYHADWSIDDRLKAHEGIVIDDGEAWRYEYTHKDAQGHYDLWYRHGDPLARKPLAEEKTLRDYFAGQALAGMITTAAAPCLNGLDGSEPLVAKYAYVMADAMLQARSKSDG
ncbi:hypothetical protein [Maritalea myrionectae]|nr:hypothetical protein [Maritalea myrionectae]